MRREKEMDFSKLAEPFDPRDIEWFIGVTSRDKTTGLAIPFITNRAVQARLDEVCGVDGWYNKYEVLKDVDKIDGNGIITGKKFSYQCGITIWSPKMNEWITKWDGAEDTDVEALKGGLSSAMKRAAVQWGIGRYLYLLDSPWVEIEKKGNTYVMKASQELILPPWAMPGGKGFPTDGASRKVTVQRIGEGRPTPAPQPGNATTGKVSQLSDRQVDRAIKKAVAAKMTEADIKLWIEKKFGISNIKALNRQQYDALCEALDKVKAQQ